MTAAVVTGSGSGIGFATALRFARQGRDVRVRGRDDARATELVDATVRRSSVTRRRGNRSFAMRSARRSPQDVIRFGIRVAVMSRRAVHVRQAYLAMRQRYGLDWESAWPLTALEAEGNLILVRQTPRGGAAR